MVSEENEYSVDCVACCNYPEKSSPPGVALLALTQRQLECHHATVHVNSPARICCDQIGTTKKRNNQPQVSTKTDSEHQEHDCGHPTGLTHSAESVIWHHDIFGELLRLQPQRRCRYFRIGDRTRRSPQWPGADFGQWQSLYAMMIDDVSWSIPVAS